MGVAVKRDGRDDCYLLVFWVEGKGKRVGEKLGRS